MVIVSSGRRGKVVIGGSVFLNIVVNPSSVKVSSGDTELVIQWNLRIPSESCEIGLAIVGAEWLDGVVGGDSAALTPNDKTIR